MCDCRFSMLPRGKRPPRWPNASSRPSAARFFISRRLFTRFYSLIMMSLSLPQLDRTRQPGFARVGASWYAPVGGAGRAGVIDITFSEIKTVGNPDSQSPKIIGAGTGLEAFAP
jgi:hypothetical protein